MRESEVQKQIIDYIEDVLGGYVIKVVRANAAGVPDLLACIPMRIATQDGITSGVFFGIEVKREGLKDNTSELQKYHLTLIKNSGGKALVVDSLIDFELALI
jgi:hypothetical protein